MKKALQSLKRINFQRLAVISVVMVFAALSACNKPKEDDSTIVNVTNTGTMNYKNEEYKLNSAKFIKQDVQNEIYCYKVFLYADDINWINGTFSKGHFASFHLYCTSSGEPSIGTYIENTSELYVSMKADSSSFYEIKDVYPFSTYEMIKPGTITLNKEGDIYNIVFSGTDGVDRPFFAEYKGTLINN